jgi:hypothetical protein
MKTKIIVCVIVNIALFSLSLIAFNEIERHKKVVDESNPITIKVIDINHSAKSSTTCTVLFNNKLYDKVKFPFNGIKINSINSEGFYYDKKKDEIFYKDIGTKTMYLVFSLSLLSLLLWFIPKNKFKLSY